MGSVVVPVHPSVSTPVVVVVVVLVVVVVVVSTILPLQKDVSDVPSA